MMPSNKKIAALVSAKVKFEWMLRIVPPSLSEEGFPQA